MSQIYSSAVDALRSYMKQNPDYQLKEPSDGFGPEDKGIDTKCPILLVSWITGNPSKACFAAVVSML